MVLPREVTGIDLAAVLGIDERSVRKLTTKKNTIKE
jgi:DNA-binding Xre family transcriptional regulator